MSSNTPLWWFALALAIAANILANAALKIAVGAVSTGTLRGAAIQLVGQPSFWIGMLAATLLLASYLVAIRGIPVSIAYAVVTSMAMVGLFLVEKLLFDVPLGASRIFGMCLVVAGIGLMVDSASTSFHR